MHRFFFERKSLFLLLIFLVGTLSFSCKSSTTTTEGDMDTEFIAEGEGEQPGDPDSVDQIDVVDGTDMDPTVEKEPGEDAEDDDRVDDEDQPTDQVDDTEDDLTDPPDETDAVETDTTETDPISLWMIFEGFVSGGGHAASSQYKLRYGRIGGAAAPGGAQSTNYRISNGGFIGR